MANLNSLIDLHIHSNTSLDGIQSVEDIIKRSKKYNVKTIAITDHNTAIGIHNFAKEHNIPDNAVKFEHNGVEVYFGTEVTARLSKVENIKNRSGKFHILCYGFDRNPNSPLMRLLEMKRQNDIENDLSYFVYLSNNYNVEFDMKELRQIALQKRMKDKTFQEFKKQDVLDYIEEKQYTFFKNKRELEFALSKCPKPNRLDIEIEDLVKIVHASGGICLVAHPMLNMMRIKDAKLGVQYLVDAGIDGFEKLENNISKKLNKGFENYFNSKNKKPIISAGSDYHVNSMTSKIGESYGKRLYKKKYVDVLQKIDNCQNFVGYIKDNEIENLIDKYKVKFNEISNDFKDFSVDTFHNILLKLNNTDARAEYKKLKQVEKNVQLKDEHSL